MIINQVEKKGELKRLFLSLFMAMILCFALISVSYAASEDDSENVGVFSKIINFIT